MAVFSSGKYALAISDRSGLVFPYSEMVREWNGSWVHFSEFEIKQPQLDPKPTSADPQALLRARPSRTALPTPAVLNDNPFTTEVGTTISTFELSTTLATTITATDTSIVLSDGSEFPTSGYIVIEATDTDSSSLQYGKITSETIEYTGRTTNTLTGCTRGTAAPSYGETPVSTTAAAHTAGAKIYGSYIITKIDSTIPYAGEPSTLPVSDSFSFTLANAASSIETGGGFFVFGGPVNDRS